MSHTITVRLTRELAEWLEEAAASTGVSQRKIVREELEKARAPRRVRARPPGPLVSQGLLAAVKGIADTGFLVAFANRADRQ